MTLDVVIYDAVVKYLENVFDLIQNDKSVYIYSLRNDRAQISKNVSNKIIKTRSCELIR